MDSVETTAPILRPTVIRSALLAALMTTGTAVAAPQSGQDDTASQGQSQNQRQNPSSQQPSGQDQQSAAYQQYLAQPADGGHDHYLGQAAQNRQGGQGYPRYHGDGPPGSRYDQPPGPMHPGMAQRHPGPNDSWFPQGPTYQAPGRFARFPADPQYPSYQQFGRAPSQQWYQRNARQQRASRYGGQGDSGYAQRQSTGQQSQAERMHRGNQVVGRDTPYTAPALTKPADALPDKYRMSSWIGRSVRNSRGVRLGTIEDMVMDDLGVLRYVVMRPDGRADDRLVAVPMGHLQYPLTGRESMVLDVSTEQMQQAPQFADSAWPNMGDRHWSSWVITYWLPRDPEQQGAGETAQGQGGQRGARGQSDVVYAPNRDMVYLTAERHAMFQELDDDGDAAIERNEASANERLAEQFDRLDTYSNDRLTRSEFSMFEIKQDPSQQ